MLSAAYDNLTQILLAALSPDIKIRKPAEEEIKKFTNNNYEAFYLSSQKNKQMKMSQITSGN